LFLKPVDRIPIPGRSLHAVAELRESFDVRFVTFEVEAAYDGTDRVCRLSRKRPCEN